MSELFYMRDSRSNTGNNVMFWNIGGAGYGTNLDGLEVYTREEAQRRHNSRNSDVPLLKSLVDEVSISAVDCQVLPESGGIDSGGEYVVQRKGHWNGNDIRFVGRFGETYEYGKAGIYTKKETEEHFSDQESFLVFSKAALDNVARRTFQVGNIDLKAMIKKPGIRLVKPKRQRPTSGKTRHNCPSCGKIVWDFNPYDAPYCSVFCEP